MSDLRPPDARVPAEAASLRVRQVLELAGIDSPIALAQRHAVSHSTSMVEAAHSHEVDADAGVVAAAVTLQLLVPVGIDDQVPVEATEREVIGFQLVRLRLSGGERAAGHLEVGHVDGPHVRHRQLQLKLAVRVGEVTVVQVRDRDVVAVALCRRLVRELHPLAGETLVHREMLPIQQRERKVHVDPQVSRCTAPY